MYNPYVQGNVIWSIYFGRKTRWASRHNHGPFPLNQRAASLYQLGSKSCPQSLFIDSLSDFSAFLLHKPVFLSLHSFGSSPRLQSDLTLRIRVRSGSPTFLRITFYIDRGFFSFLNQRERAKQCDVHTRPLYLQTCQHALWHLGASQLLGYAHRHWQSEDEISSRRIYFVWGTTPLTLLSAVTRSPLLLLNVDSARIFLFLMVLLRYHGKMCEDSTSGGKSSVSSKSNGKLGRTRVKFKQNSH